jgi:N-acetylated-alpha-linked acidic dipeptidase
VTRLQKAARQYKGGNDAVARRLEQLLTRDEGLPGRPWYRHHVYAPGFYTGYGVKTLPGVREAIEQRKWRDADAQIIVLAKVLEGYAAALEGRPSASR